MQPLERVAGEAVSQPSLVVKVPERRLTFILLRGRACVRLVRSSVASPLWVHFFYPDYWLRAARPVPEIVPRPAVIRTHIERVRRRAGITLAVSGAENLPARGGFVLVYNQTSILDDLGNPEVLWTHGVDFSVVAAEYGQIPFVRRAAERTGILLLRRGNRRAALPDWCSHRLRSLYRGASPPACRTGSGGGGGSISAGARRGGSGRQEVAA